MPFFVHDVFIEFLAGGRFTYNVFKGIAKCARYWPAGPGGGYSFGRCVTVAVTRYWFTSPGV